MSMMNFSQLDQAELMQLALDASIRGEAGAAISYLKEAVSRMDASAEAHFLLGSEYAAIKLYERAVGEMEAAVALDPGFSIARLQLGLLWLTSGDTARSESVLLPLLELPVEEPIRLFGQGLLHLIRDEMQEAANCLSQGIAENKTNDALNGNMRILATEIARVSGIAPADGTEPAPVDGRHMLLSVYQGN